MKRFNNKTYKLTRQVKPYSKEIKLYNEGFCKYLTHLGTDITPVESARMSTQNPTGIDEKGDDRLREYLWRKNHVSVFEQCELVVEVQIPISVARQVLRSRTLQPNEFSMRYSEPLHLYYIPEEDAICLDDENNKQQSGIPCPKELAQEFIDDMKADAILHQVRYEKYRKQGIAKERVRDFQPVSAYTKLRLKCNLRNWFHFLNLRLHNGAQREIVELAQAIYEIIKDLFPKCAKLFDEYTLNGKSYSKTENELTTDLIDMLISDAKWSIPAYWKQDVEKKLGKSRAREYFEKLGVNN